MKPGAAAEPNWLAQLEHPLELLRRASPGTWICYLAGALPFTLALIYFLMEMLQGAYARQRLMPASLALSLLYIWKQSWQAAFMAGLRDQLAGESTPWSIRRAVHTVTRQAAWQPFALAAIPLAFLALVPFPTVFAFFRQMSLQAGRGEAAGLRPPAALGSLKTHTIALLIFLLAALYLWLNIFVTIIFLPQLGQSFFGIVTDWTRMGALLMNRVTVGTALLLSWLLLDPLIDAFYVQRTFRREARSSGVDLQAALRRLLATAALMALVAPGAPAQTIAPEKIDRAAEQVLQREEFAWRTPTAPVDEGPVMSWFRQASRWVNQKIKGLVDWLDKLFEKPDNALEPGGGTAGSVSSLRLLLIGLAAVIVALAAVLFYRSWSRARTLRSAAPAQRPLTRVNVADENVAADAMEESGWLNLADELIAQGDYRLALRALHLGGLRYLGGRGVITLARWKSGYEYQREIDRRLRQAPQVSQLFGGSLLQFEMVWYGRHTATPEAVLAVRDRWKEIRTHAA